MSDEKIFRKAAVERLSSPENLDQVMHVVSPKNWAVLICLFIVAAAAVVWICLGQIAQLADGKGALLSRGTAGSRSVVAVLSAKDGRSVQPGMEALITLDSANKYPLTGKVVSVSVIDGKTATFTGISIPEEAFSGWEIGSGDIAVMISLDADQMDKAGVALSTVTPQSVGNSTGWACNVQITLKSVHPLELLQPE